MKLTNVQLNGTIFFIPSSNKKMINNRETFFDTTITSPDITETSTFRPSYTSNCSNIAGVCVNGFRLQTTKERTNKRRPIMIFTFSRGSNNNTAARDKNFITRLKLVGKSSTAMRTGSCDSERRKNKKKRNEQRERRTRV